MTTVLVMMDPFRSKETYVKIIKVSGYVWKVDEDDCDEQAQDQLLEAWCTAAEQQNLAVGIVTTIIEDAE